MFYRHFGTHTHTTEIGIYVYMYVCILCVCVCVRNTKWRQFPLPLGSLHRLVRLNLNRQKSLSTQGPEGQKKQGGKKSGLKGEKTSTN